MVILSIPDISCSTHDWYSYFRLASSGNVCSQYWLGVTIKSCGTISILDFALPPCCFLNCTYITLKVVYFFNTCCHFLRLSLVALLLLLPQEFS
jgi:hypothetical protein